MKNPARILMACLLVLGLALSLGTRRNSPDRDSHLNRHCFGSERCAGA